MFETLRKLILPIIITVLFFFVAMIVLEWGLGLSRRQDYVDADVAAVINGEKVSWQAYNRLYSSLYEMESAKTEEELPEAKIREIHDRAWRQLLHDYLLLQKARQYGLTVTDDEVYTFLRSNPPPELQQAPYFQTDGQFDYQKYFAAMTDPQTADFWRGMEPFARESVLKQKMQLMILSAAHVTEEEIKDFYLSENEKIKVGVVNVEFKRFTNPSPHFTEEDRRAYFEEHRDDYRINERAALNLAIIEKKPEPLDWERTYHKAKALYDSVQAGADFADLAVRYSEDPGSVKDGGDLGWFPRGQMVEEFDRMVFNMQPGQVSEPVRSEFGWHIIKLHDRKEEMQRKPGSTE
ncbi:MAG: peptidylprolyl isomerase, partial [Candidatus Zixiibacteriota bacterium]